MAASGAGASASHGASSLLNVTGSGTGGVAQLAAALDPTTVTFAVARVPLGTGTFARNKTILLHINSEGCSALKRGRINGRKGAVRSALGDIHAELTYDDTKEVTLENVLEQCRKVIAADDTGAFSISKMKEDYEAMIKKNVEEEASAPEAGAVALTRKTAAELGDIKAEQALKAVREPLGAWNWTLFDSEFHFVNAGSLSVPEMTKWLKDDAVLFGLLRLGFGTGRFRRTKWIFLAWSGPAVGAVKRAKAAANRGTLKSKLGSTSVDIEATSKDDVSLEAIIAKVKKATVVDGDDVHSEEDPFSVESFMKALQEEAAASSAFFGDSGLVVGGTTKSAETLLEEVRSGKAATNWVSFSVNV